ncbi:hypothetical protein QBC42DRAFT_331205 [Cladorrhinum samala]|uniref:4'-phosphopantetheinyl transferase domain-containing protein n=1 Tax=Cladorrhinum samala TaxID=585594 RepID=A0AAV9HPQ5_9PEZI|nr:hypothetical protein QBC42DRAFT_331205 [Cladorrhinum samala]
MRPPPLPFPLPISIGTDLCRISRIYEIIGSSAPRAQRFIRRVLTPEEIEACLRSEKRSYIKTILDRNPLELSEAAKKLGKSKYNKSKREKAKMAKAYDEVLKQASRFLAGRWAAKEAGIKAHSWRAGVGLREVEFVSAGAGVGGAVEGVRGEGVHVGGVGEGVGGLGVGGLGGGGGGGGSGGGGGGGEAEVQEPGDQSSWWPVDRGNGSEAPTVIIRGHRDGVRDQMALMSISHDGDYATAVCLGFNPSWEGWGPITNTCSGSNQGKGGPVELNGMKGVGLQSKGQMLSSREGEGEGAERDSAEIKISKAPTEVPASGEIDLEKAFAVLEEAPQEEEDTSWVDMMEGNLTEGQAQTAPAATAATAKPTKKEPKKRTWTFRKGRMIVQVPRKR